MKTGTCRRSEELDGRGLRGVEMYLLWAMLMLLKVIFGMDDIEVLLLDVELCLSALTRAMKYARQHPTAVL